MYSRENNTIRLNVINRDNESNRISIIVSPRMPISKLKRKIQEQYFELYGISIIVSVIQDNKGFIISNNSTIGQHTQTNDTVYIEVHKDKTGTNMNLTSDITDNLMTLRYVAGSVMQKIDKLQINQETVVQIISQVLHLGFWHHNTDVAIKACKFLNKCLTPKAVEYFAINSHQINHVLLLKLLNFWLIEVANAFTIYPDICWELLQAVQKLSNNSKYVQILKNSPLTKTILQLSKDTSLQSEVKKMSIKILKNINGGKGGYISKTQSSYIPTMLQQSNFDFNLQSVLQMLTDSNEKQLKAIDFLSDPNLQLVMEATVRFDYYAKLMNIFTIRNIRSKTQIVKLNNIIRQIIQNTTKQKAVQIMQKDIIKKLHKFMQQAPVQLHVSLLNFITIICKQSTALSMFNIQVGIQLIFSPYIEFQKIIIESLCEMSQPDKKVSKIRFIPSIKDIIRLSLKSQIPQIIKKCLKIISNLCLDEQCRYQIINLKGIQLFVKYLEASKNQQIERICAKGLLNLSLSSRENKVKALSLMTNIIQKYYHTDYDTITTGYIQTILKSPK